MDETNLPLSFVKLFGMTSGASVRGGPNLGEKCFQLFQLSIEKFSENLCSIVA